MTSLCRSGLRIRSRLISILVQSLAIYSVYITNATEQRRHFLRTADVILAGCEETLIQTPCSAFTKPWKISRWVRKHKYLHLGIRLLSHLILNSLSFSPVFPSLPLVLQLISSLNIIGTSASLNCCDHFHSFPSSSLAQYSNLHKFVTSQTIYWAVWSFSVSDMWPAPFLSLFTLTSVETASRNLPLFFLLRQGRQTDEGEPPIIFHSA